MKFLPHIFIPVLLFAEIFSSCHPNSKHTPPLSAADSLLIQQWKSQAVSFFKTNPDSFATLQLQCASKFKQTDHLGNWLNCYDTIINAYRKQEAFDKMLATYGQLYKNLWREPTDSFSLVTLAESNRQVARYYYKTQNDYEKALHFYDEGIKLMTQAHGWSPDESRIFYKAAGNCASRMDDYEKSISYHERNVQVCRDFKDTINLWQALNDLSNPYQNAGQFDKAEKTLRECYALVINSDSTEQKIDVCSSFADLFTQKNQLDSAQRYLDLCFKYLAQWKNREADSEADVNRQQGELFLLQKNFAAAEKNYSKSVELMKSSGEGRRRECGKVLGEFGNMYVEAGKEKQAMEKFHESLQCLIPDFKSDDVNAAPDSSLLIDENGIFITCEGMGDACIKLYSKTHDPKYLKYAAQNYHTAKLVLEKRDRGMQNEASRIRFDETSKNILVKAKAADSLLRAHNSN